MKSMSGIRSYPGAIEAAALVTITINQRLADYRQAVETINDSLTFEVIFAINPDTEKPLFTNEQQRSTAIRERQRDHQAYQSLLKNIEEAEHLKAVNTAKLERLRGEFSVLKLEYRAEIAGVEAD